VEFELSKETREQMRYNTEMYVGMVKKWQTLSLNLQR
jgi:hypothetical protein